MEQDIKAFLDFLAKEKNYSHNTLAAYNNDLNQLAKYVKTEMHEAIPSASWSSLNDESLSGYIYSLKHKGYTSSTIARKVAAAKSFFTFMSSKGRLKSNLSSKLASPHVTKSSPKPLSVSEVRRLLAEPSKLSTPEAKRDKVMLEMLYATGLRASELMSLNLSDINLKSNTVYCSGQNFKVRAIPIDGYISQVVAEYINMARPHILSNEQGNALFLNQRGERLTRQGFWQIVRGYAEKAGLEAKVTPRTLRHSFAMHKLRGGADLQSMQEILGHSHISTTRVYKQADSQL